MLWSYNGFSLLQDLVVLAEGGQEDERGHVFETVDPLPTLRLLTAHIYDPVAGRKRTEFKVKKKPNTSIFEIMRSPKNCNLWLTSTIDKYNY